MTPRARFTGNSFLCTYMKALSVLSVISLEDICDKATFTWSNGRASGLPGSTFGRGMGSMSDARSSAIDQQCDRSLSHGTHCAASLVGRSPLGIQITWLVPFFRREYLAPSPQTARQISLSQVISDNALTRQIPALRMTLAVLLSSFSQYFLYRLPSTRGSSSGFLAGG
jgi:hypothetical protein